ncbi:aldo/keto reductase [Candidatus Stoquefichus sp. SB1]|uniref:aldo/keto reductase n=1 Tax=Candidatus Stoquefichus sp. SB1 TaxID=1658109 RepID=UPI00067F623E|nr:aldo/keto reductase [Candidatus Stoquefichus sp. SB1]
MNSRKLGFGLMRLPLNSDNPTDIDQQQLNQMVDLFIKEGFTYFDTSYVYHNGESEIAIKKALVERHDRNHYVLASKFPTFQMPDDHQIEGIFQEQLDKCGVEYFDYYLLHNLNRVLYEREVEKYHLFDYMKKWKREGKIKHIGFSYHDDAFHLDKILTEHPEVEFVQIVMNYYDDEEPMIQGKACYDVIRKHGCQVVIMEPVKGGALMNVPSSALQKMQSLHKEASTASYAIRYCASYDGVLAVLSGMSSLEQVKDNTSYMKDFQPLSHEEYDILRYTKQEIMKKWKYQCNDMSVLDDNVYHVPLSAILRTYNSLLIQPNPTFGAELNYYKSFRTAYDRAFEKADYSSLNAKINDAFDVNIAVKEAIAFLIQNSFQGYIEDN